MEPTPLHITAIDQLIEDVAAVPDDVDGIDLKPSKQEATIQLTLVRGSVLRLRKLATPLD